MSNEHRAAILRAAMDKNLTLIINGKSRRITLLSAILWRLVEQAVAADSASGEFVYLVFNDQPDGDPHE